MKYHLIIFTALIYGFIFTGCKSDDEEELKPLELTSFVFRKGYNNKLNADVSCNIQDGTIIALIKEIDSAEGLIPSFSGSFDKIEVNGKLQQSDVQAHDFNEIVTYRLTGKNGVVKEYNVMIRVWTGLPIVRITTEGRQPVTSKEEYVKGSVSISKIPQFESGYEGTMRIRGRGNATWFSYPKKPYRIKLDSKSSILGMPSDKDWVLLADYCDKSLLRNTYAFELSKLLDMPWTPHGYHVEMYMNGAYEGTYFLGEHVKVAPHRANIADDGYLIENDNYWHQEPMWFTTENTKTNYTFKHPDTDDMTIGDEKYTFILNFMNKFEAALFSSDFTNPNTGYRKYIDTDNFAKWYLLQEVLGNIDTNPYYALESRTGKLKMYPVWDFEWSLGLAAIGSDGWATPPATSPVDRLYRRDAYFRQLFKDPSFVDEVKKIWKQMKESSLPELNKIIEEKKQNIRFAKDQNFFRWQILGQYTSVGLTRYPTWEEEVNHAKKFLDERIAWLDTEIQKW